MRGNGYFLTGSLVRGCFFICFQFGKRLNCPEFVPGGVNYGAIMIFQVRDSKESERVRESGDFCVALLKVYMA